MMDQPSPDAPHLLKTLGPVDATCVVVGAIIGVGIFFTPSRVAALAGSANMALLAWAVGGCIALLGALTFAELGGLYPRTGGQYLILREAFGPPAGFLFVFCNATAVQAGSIAIIAIVCAQNLGLAVRAETPTHSVQMALATILIVGLTIANCVGVRWGSRIQNLTVVAKVATLIVVMVLAGLSNSPRPPTRLPAETWHPELLSGVAAALVPILFSYGGWQHALWIAGEVRKPKRDIPLAIVVGVLVVTVVYLLANWAYFSLLGFEAVVQSKTLAADAVATAWPIAGRRIIAGAVALSAFGVLNTQLLTGPRLIYGMAVDGRFFKPFARINATFSTPVAAILLLSVVPLCLLYVAGEKGVDKILNGAVLIDGCFLALTGLALIVLRRTRSDAERPFRVPGYPLVPLLFVAGEGLVVVGAFCDPNVRASAHLALAWLAAAGVCYVVFFSNKRVSAHPD